ncbi:multidrug ABC transporter ATP-binding protein, partial [Epulopiscium sp. SCG-B10WGA-EpuloA2]
FFDNLPVGKILSRVVGDVNALQNLLNTSIVSLIPNFFTIILVISMMLILSPTLTLICFLVLPILFVSMIWIEVRAHKLWGIYREHRSEFMGFTHEAFSGGKITQSFATEHFMQKKFKHYLNKQADGFITAVKLQDYLFPTNDFCRALGICTILVSGYFLVQNKTVEVTTLLAFILYLEMLWRPIMQLTEFYNTFMTNLSAADRIFDILDTASDSDEDLKNVMPTIKGAITFENVSFSYDDDDKHALRDVSFTIEAGQKVALVGETGSGKTTIINLISKFYSPNQGRILIDGIPIKDKFTESIRAQMGVMLQDSFLFANSIKENISYGKLDATDEEIINACKAVNVDSFVTDLTEGYDTNVNERGSRLSQGQRQLIAFARALISDPKILILDEATANIDTQTERLVQQGIIKLMEGRTSIVIAHRLSTIRDCDKIFVLSKGKIVEVGTHDELLKSGGYYAELFYAQYKFLT